MQCIHDTVYTLEHPCYATLSLSQFLQLKRKKHKKKREKKNVFIGSTAKKRISDSDCTEKNTDIKEIKALFYMSLKENITDINKYETICSTHKILQNCLLIYGN